MFCWYDGRTDNVTQAGRGLETGLGLLTWGSWGGEQTDGIWMMPTRFLLDLDMATVKDIIMKAKPEAVALACGLVATTGCVVSFPSLACTSPNLGLTLEQHIRNYRCQAQLLDWQQHKGDLGLGSLVQPKAGSAT